MAGSGVTVYRPGRGGGSAARVRRPAEPGPRGPGPSAGTVLAVPRRRGRARREWSDVPGVQRGVRVIRGYDLRGAGAVVGAVAGGETAIRGVRGRHADRGALEPVRDLPPVAGRVRAGRAGVRGLQRERQSLGGTDRGPAADVFRLGKSGGCGVSFLLGREISPAEQPALLEALEGAVRERTRLRPDIGLVLGSGLGGPGRCDGAGCRDPIRRSARLAAGDCARPRRPAVFGRLAGVPVVVQQGRFHLYEGHSAGFRGAARASHGAAGARAVVLTNAAGGVNPGIRAPARSWSSPTTST